MQAGPRCRHPVICCAKVRVKPVLQLDVGCCQVSCSVIHNLMVGHLLVPALVDVDHLVDLAKFDHRVTVWSLLIIC